MTTCALGRAGARRRGALARRQLVGDGEQRRRLARRQRSEFVGSEVELAGQPGEAPGGAVGGLLRGGRDAFGERFPAVRAGAFGGQPDEVGDGVLRCLVEPAAPPGVAHVDLGGARRVMGEQAGQVERFAGQALAQLGA